MHVDDDMLARLRPVYNHRVKLRTVPYACLSCGGPVTVSVYENGELGDKKDIDRQALLDEAIALLVESRSVLPLHWCCTCNPSDNGTIQCAACKWYRKVRQITDTVERRR